MGACGSNPSRCVGVGDGGGGLNLGKKSRIRRRRKRAKTQSNKLSKVEPSLKSAGVSFSNAAFQGNADCWYDPEAGSGSECDSDFYSVQEDTPRSGDDNLEGNTLNDRYRPHVTDNERGQTNQTSSPASKVERTLQSSGPSGPQPNHCLPSLFSNSPDDKMKSFVQRAVTFKKRASFKLSFKRRESSTTLSPRAILQKPVAGSQIVNRSADERIPDSWSQISPSMFRVRGTTFLRDKKKEPAPDYAAYYPVGADVFLTPRKIDHIARFVQLPSVDSTGEIPSILVVNLQVPLYPATLFQSEYNGEGISFVFYFRLNKNYEKELPIHFQQNLKKIIDGETEKVKSFRLESNAPLRDRLKILARLVNVEELHFGTTEKKLVNNYNEKPVLSRPQHECYLGENYLEIDLDIHRFSYIARKGFESFHDRLKNCVIDFGLTIQGNKAEELPECMLCCLRLNEVDYPSYSQLQV